MKKSTDKLNAWVDRLTIGLFLVAIFAPVFLWWAGWGLPDTTAEKRGLSRRPVWTWNRDVIDKYPYRFNAYFNDRFGFRTQLIYLHSRLLFYGLGMSPTKQVVLGKEGWLYYNGTPTGDGDSLADFRGLRPLGTRDLEKWRWTFQDMHEWLSEQGIPLLVVAVPDKPLIYPEYMPDIYTKVGDARPIDQVTAYIEAKTKVPYISLVEPLRAGREKEGTYLQTDTHWNDYGAYLGYQAIMNQVTEWFPNLTAYDLAEFTRRDVDYSGDLAGLMALEGVLSETFSALVQHTPRRWEKHTGRGRLPDIVTTLPDDRLPKLLMYRDSFCDPLINYLSEHFRKARYRWNDWGFDPRVVLREKPDLVILQTGDRRFRRHLKLDESVSIKLAQQRFEEAPSSSVLWSTESGFEDIKVLEGAELVPGAGGLAVKATGRYPHLQLPVIEGSDKLLPLVKIDITAPRRVDLELKWESDEANAQSPLDPWVSAKLVKGRNTIYFPLKDPTMKGPLQLDPGVGEGTYILHQIEVRSIPR